MIPALSNTIQTRRLEQLVCGNEQWIQRSEKIGRSIRPTKYESSALPARFCRLERVNMRAMHRGKIIR